MADVFFRASKDALDNITTAFDNVHDLFPRTLDNNRGRSS